MSELLVGPGDLRKSHRAFLNAEPSTRQVQVYGAFPTQRGIVGSVGDAEAFDAVMIMALVQTFSMKVQPDPFRVFMFVPAHAERWVAGELNRFAETVFGMLKSRKAATQAKAMGRAFHAIHSGCRVFQFETAPERWVAFGFTDTDPMPDWLKVGSGPMGT